MMSNLLDRLIEGIHCCVCGLPGTYRSASLAKIAEAALDCGFLVFRRDALDIPCQPEAWSRYRDALRVDLSSSEVAKVVIFDNCDRAFSGAARNSVEKILSLVGFGDTIDSCGQSRIVFALSPRDIDVLGLSPDVRERCSVFASQDIALPESLSPQPIGDVWFAQIVGGLRRADRERCRDVISAVRTAPRRWRQGDRFLFPLVHSSQGFALPNPCLLEWQSQALLGGLWPDKDLNLSACRFSSLIGFEQRVLWVDPYLSWEAKYFEISKLKSFLAGLFRITPTLLHVEMLARVGNVGGVPILREKAVDALSGEPWRARVAWRVFERAGGMVHDRHLVLRNREEAFSLPPADRVLGLNTVGNEADGVLSYLASLPEREMWNDAVRIYP